MTDAFTKAMNAVFTTPNVSAHFPEGLPAPLVKLRDGLLAVDAAIGSDAKMHMHRENSQLALLNIAEMSVQDFCANTDLRNQFAPRPPGLDPRK